MLTDLVPDLDEVRTCSTAWRRQPTRYRLRAWHGPRVAVVTEQADNQGPSVTNAAEDVWLDALRVLPRGYGVPWRCVEHYDDVESYGLSHRGGQSRLVQVGLFPTRWSPLPGDLDWLREALV